MDMEMEFGELPQSRHFADEISEERWTRAREDVDIVALVLDLTGSKIKGKAISCPFHGRDSRPSFYLYKNTNSSYCFGCPPGANFFDTIGFVSKFRECSPAQAVMWLEKNYELPDLAPTAKEAPFVPKWLLSVEELKEAYFKQVRHSLKREPNLANAKLYIDIYWEALDTEDPTEMAQVVGRDKIEQIMRRASGRARS
jgi:DNA primase